MNKFFSQLLSLSLALNLQLNKCLSMEQESNSKDFYRKIEQKKRKTQLHRKSYNISVPNDIVEINCNYCNYRFYAKVSTICSHYRVVHKMNIYPLLTKNHLLNALMKKT